MWQYNYYPSGELCHFGIRGMKWGRRRYQNKDGSLTPAGEKRYNPTKADEVQFGKKGAQRIADRRNKGMSRDKAVKKEYVRIGTKTVAIAAIGAAGVYALTRANMDSVAKEYVNAGKKAAKEASKSYMNASVLDKSGKVVSRYHDTVKVGETVANALIKK